ncbi:MAG TPA: VOC family protein [Chitinophagaceae bacterium]|jgi:lactoylglutathione lyase|nr:VOC family protein [Chitinophagaceae bacterium]
MKKIPAIFLLALTLFTSQKMFSQQKVLLNHIAVYVVDLKISTAFYKDIIGLDTIPEPFHDGRHTWFSVGVKSHLHVISGATAKTAHDKNAHLCFSVASVPEFVKVLEKNKVEYENWAGEKMTITTRVDGVKQIYFKDPDGYWIEINDAKE